MMLLTLAGSAIGNWLRRVILAVARPAPHRDRVVLTERRRAAPPPEFYRFPIF